MKILVCGPDYDHDNIHVEVKHITALMDEIVFTLDNDTTISTYTDMDDDKLIVTVCPVPKRSQVIYGIPDYWTAFTLALKNEFVGTPPQRDGVNIVRYGSTKTEEV